MEDYNSTAAGGGGGQPLPPGVTSVPEAADCTLFYFVAWGVVVSCLCLYGFFANALSVVAFGRCRPRDAATTLVQCLAASDFTLLVTVFITDCVPYICDFSGTCGNPWVTWPYIRYVWILTPCAHMCSVWLVVLISLNRFWAVCRGPELGRVWTTARTAAYIAGTAAAVAAFNTPRFFEYKMERVQVDNGTWAVRETRTHFGSTDSYKKVYKSWLTVACQLFLPLSLLAVFTARTLYTLKRSAGRVKASSCVGDKKASSRAKAQMEVTVVLIAVVLVTIACQTPLGVFHFVRYNQWMACGTLVFYLDNVSKMLVNVNSSINFLLYYVASRKFRKLLLSVMRCGAAAENGPMGASETSAAAGQRLRVAGTNAGHSTA